MPVKILHGDCLQVLRGMPDDSVNCCVTSPPYWGLRDYGVEGQLGLEATLAQYVTKMVDVFREVRRVLRPDGTLWLNLGDSYAREGGRQGGENRALMHMASKQQRMLKIPAGSGLKPKDLVGIPWRVAFALQADGWYLRQDIIWAKTNTMPESVRDRCTKAHEYIFLMSKSERYWFDAHAISEPCSENTHARVSQDIANQIGTARANGGRKTNGNLKAVVNGSTRKLAKAGSGIKSNDSFKSAVCLLVEKRNKRSVWSVALQSYKGAHFATFPPKLIEPCILAGCPEQVCGKCGLPFIRKTKSERVATRPGKKTKVPGRNSRLYKERDPNHTGEFKASRFELEVGNRDPQRHITRMVDLGLVPACECGEQPRAGVVLDPFFGSGTTGQVAIHFGRDCIGIELNEKYIELANQRLQQRRLF